MTSTITTTTTTNHNEEEHGDDEESKAKELEDPSLSSASLCISFQRMGETFRPVFTHQAFPGEWIRGYHPPLKTLLENTPKEKLQQHQNDDDGEGNKTKLVHSSHKNHEIASKELSIVIELAPSGETCCATIQTEKKRLPRPTRRQSSRASKRPRLADESSKDETTKEESEKASSEDEKERSEDDDEEEIVSSSASEQDIGDEDSEFEDDEGGSEIEEDQHNDQEGTTRRRRMPAKEILSSLQQGLPEVVQQPKNAKVSDNFLRRPVGVELREYSVGGRDFCLSLAHGPDVVQYHDKIQRLALWFIETADTVDVSSLEGGFWKVLYLFQKHKRTQYSLAGYITLFYFHAPFKKPHPGFVVRVCQALVLPPYQRSGHGKQLLKSVFDLAHGKYQDTLQDKKGDAIVEINVESPAPAFVLLRNRVDYECFMRSIEARDPWIDGTAADINDPEYFSSVPESEAIQAAAKAKITPRQIHIVHELYKFGRLQEHLKTNSSDAELLEKRFRLMVKKRLNREHSEDISGLRTKADKQAFLENAFQKCLQSYYITIPKAS